MSFLPGTHILSTIQEENNSIKFWDTGTQTMQNKEGHNSGVLLIKFSLDSQKMASWGLDSTLRLWDVKNGHQFYVKNIKEKIEIDKILFSNDSQFIILQVSEFTQGLNQQLLIFHYEENEQVTITYAKGYKDCNIEAHIICQPYGQIIAWGICDCDADVSFIKLYDVKEMKIKQIQSPKNQQTFQIKFSKNGQMLLSWGFSSNLYIWNVETCHLVESFDDVTKIDWFNNDIQLIAQDLHLQINSRFISRKINGLTHIQLQLVCILKRRTMIQSQYNFNHQFVKQLLSLKRILLKTFLLYSSSLLIYDIGNLKQLGLIQNTEGKQYTFSNITIAEYLENKIIISNISNGQQVAVLEYPQNRIIKAVYSPDGEMLVKFGDDGVLIIFETSTFSLLKNLDTHTEQVLDVIFSPNGQFIASQTQVKFVIQKQQNCLFYCTNQFIQKAQSNFF